MPNHWDDLKATFTLSDARIVAALAGGGAVVEEGLQLCASEGRQQSWRTVGNQTICELEYKLLLWVDNDREAEVMEAVRARIIVEGVHRNGLRLEVRGEGWIGFNEHSDIECWFDEPPGIIAEDREEDRYPVPAEDMEAFEGALDLPSAKPSPQLARALHGRRVDEADEHDEGDDDDEEEWPVKPL